ncbi:MAG: ABC transporter ATP-binding protein [Cytophagaceae bacterium]
MKPILEFINVSKRFKIRKDSQPYLSIRDSLANLSFLKKEPKEEFYALQDVSFEVFAGECIGIIGKNGAGKSTLLKILSKITPPSHGKIISRGRVASLLEVGTGFHPELSGKENIFLNGSILGMTYKEIKGNLDAIVNFSGIEKFLDTPLKHYSSGMQLRLAFSVAAFLEPEILVIDEVLAVGDSEFQKKCINKMGEVSKSGRTILFVSHNMSAVEMLCSKAILLSKGKVKSFDSVGKVVSDYINDNISDVESFSGILDLDKTKFIKRIEVYSDGRISPEIAVGSEMKIKVYFQTDNKLDFPLLGIVIKDSYGMPLIGINNRHYVGNLALNPVNSGVISITIPKFPFMPGIYSVDVHFGNAFIDLEILKDVFSITVNKVIQNSQGEFPMESLNKIYIDNINWKLEQI